MSSPITNVFVVVLENRSFDHMLGFSGITGTDAQTGQPTTIQGLTGSESNTNTVKGPQQTYTVSQPAPATVAVDPGHEFLDVLIQLSGPDAQYPSGGPYPPLNNSGFVDDYAQSPSSGEGNAPLADVGQVMQMFSTSQLPVLNALANEFCVCDQWFASMPGPTWPNRLFAHGASSGGLDHSPSTTEIVRWETKFLSSGFTFPNGSIFDAITKAGKQWRLYFGGDPKPLGSPLGNLPIVSALHNITLSDVKPISQFASDLAGNYPYIYTYIEPSYGAVASGTYEGGESQHPLDGVTNGESFLQLIYQTLRASPIWNTSLLIITWDEHGGFYDHVPPPPGVNPGDTGFNSPNNQFQFNFEQLGVRVPAIVVSPLIPQNLIDHRTYDHSSIPATVEAIFNIPPLTARDAAANNVSTLVTLTTPRDTPTTLPTPTVPSASEIGTAVQQRAATAAAKIDEPVNTGNLPGFVHLAMRADKQISPPETYPAIHERVANLQTRADAIQYLQEVNAKLRAAQPQQ